MRYKILFLGIMCSSIAMSADWALPHISVANVRTEPRHGAEMSTQALMGTPLKIVDSLDGGWFKVVMPDGYEGYIKDNSLTLLNDDDMRHWRHAERVMVTSPVEVKMYADKLRNEVVTDLVTGDILEVIDDGRLRLPDGRTGYIDGDVTSLDSLQSDDTPAAVVKVALAQMGTPYLWGGLSNKGMDCSGLVKLAYYSIGVITLRDASQQATTGIVPDGKLSAGDLIFYGNKLGRINHVAIYEGNDSVIESAGRVMRTHINDAGHRITSRRIAGSEGSRGVTRITDHPWYFDQESVKK